MSTAPTLNLIVDRPGAQPAVPAGSGAIHLHLHLGVPAPDAQPTRTPPVAATAASSSTPDTARQKLWLLSVSAIVLASATGYLFGSGGTNAARAPVPASAATPFIPEPLPPGAEEGAEAALQRQLTQRPTVTSSSGARPAPAAGGGGGGTPGNNAFGLEN